MWEGATGEDSPSRARVIRREGVDDSMYILTSGQHTARTKLSGMTTRTPGVVRDGHGIDVGKHRGMASGEAVPRRGLDNACVSWWLGEGLRKMNVRLWAKQFPALEATWARTYACDGLRGRCTGRLHSSDRWIRAGKQRLHVDGVTLIVDTHVRAWGEAGT
jgi:hypothetical protein